MITLRHCASGYLFLKQKNVFTAQANDKMLYILSVFLMTVASSGHQKDSFSPVGEDQVAALTIW